MNKVTIAVTAFLAGGLTVWGYNHARATHDSFFKTASVAKKVEDPFEELRQMQRQSLRTFNEDFFENDPFEGWVKKIFNTQNQEIKQREDQNYLYYEVDLNGKSPKQVRVEVRDGQVVVSGTVETQEKKENSSHYYSSSFHRSFPVPAGVDGTNFKTEQEGGKIVIKFPKMNS